jgi:hypothetical protein
VPASRYFRETDASRAIADDARTKINPDPAQPRPVTTKSKHNALAAV